MSVKKRLYNFFNKLKSNYIYRSLFITIILVLLVLLPLGTFLDSQHKKSLIQNKRSEVKNELNKYSILLTNLLNERISLLTSLETYAKNNWDSGISKNGFNNFASGLYYSSSGIRNLIIAPDGINKYVYPIKNNKEALGHNLINDNRKYVRTAVQKTINTRKIEMSGPYELRQEGQGIILRKAIFKEDEFWGLITMALDMKSLYEFLGLDINRNSSINIALKRSNNIFYGSEKVFNSNPVINNVNFKGGSFTIAAIPEENWLNSINSDLKFFRFILLIIIVFLSIITYLLNYRNLKIRSLVRTRTKDLKKINNSLKEKEKIIRKEKEKIKYKAYNDHLTGLHNRRFFDKKINKIDKKTNLPISIIMIDVNGLKIINDSYGHKMGDELLIKTAEILKNSIIENDVIARMGGDEFAIVLTNTNNEKAKKITNEINKRCKKNKYSPIPISLGIGIATKRKENIDIKDILKKADNMMYKNKLSKNRSAKRQIIQRLLTTLCAKSNESKKHLIRMTKLSQIFGKKLGLSNPNLNKLSRLAALHDIGKTTISKKLLTKSNSLTDKEWEIMKEHPVTGYKITVSSEEFAGIADSILYHHERWDGSGYPNGLKGEDIPYLGRIISIIDAYDVMTHDRPYSKAISKNKALTEIKSCAGSQFDPQLAQKFIELINNDKGKALG